MRLPLISLKNVFESSTLMTLFSLSSKSLVFVIVTPFLLSTFTVEEIALWYILGVFINLQSLADFGFYNTFVRTIALSLSGGCTTIEDLNRIQDLNRNVGDANISLAGSIIGTMRRVYNSLTFVIFIVLLLLSPLLYKSVSVIANPLEGWLCWIVVVLFSVINFWGRPYSNFLLAQNEVALVRKWEGVFNMIAMIANLIVISFFKSLLLLVLSNQIWILINVIRNRYLANNSGCYSFRDFASYKYNKVVMSYIWPLAWRAGLSSLITRGVVGASGLIYAQFGSAASASSYLFAEKLYTSLRAFAIAPFYSKIPLLVTLRGQEKIKEWESTSQRCMLYASSILVLGIIFFDLFGSYLFCIIKSNVVFPNHSLWLLIGWAYLLHRYGAMHTQLYTTINKVNSHISDLITGVIMILFWFFLAKDLDVYVFPLGMLTGYLGFYIWYAGYYSYRNIMRSIFSFEAKANLPPFLVLLLYTLVIAIISRY